MKSGELRHAWIPPVPMATGSEEVRKEDEDQKTLPAVRRRDARRDRMGTKPQASEVTWSQETPLEYCKQLYIFDF